MTRAFLPLTWLRDSLGRRPGLWLFAGMFCALSLWSIRFGTVQLYYDSDGYWQAGGIVDASGSYSLRAWVSPMRGYLMPTLSYGAIQMAEAISLPPDTMMKLLCAAAFAWCTAIAFPAMLEAAFRTRFGFVTRFVFCVLVLVFWYGWVLWPLSDFFSLAAAAHAAAFLLRSARARRIAVAIALSGAAGLLLGTATNVRPVYSIVWYLVAVALVVAVAWNRRDALRWSGILVAFVVGTIVVSAPQAWLNRVHDRPLNPFAFTHEQGGDLYRFTLDNGFRYPKYETNVGDRAFAFGGVAVRDVMGEELHREFHTVCCPDPNEQFEYAVYARFVIDHPLEMTYLYVRHVVDGLDVWWTYPYVEQVRPVPSWRRVLNYAVWFATAALVVGFFVQLLRSPRPRRLVPWTGLATVAVLIGLPTLLVIPGGVESRYYLPLFFLGYAAVAFAVLPRLATRAWWNWPRLWLVPALIAWCALWLQHSDTMVLRMYN